MAETQVNIILTTFVSLLIASVLIAALAGNVVEKTYPTQITNQTFDISGARAAGSYVNPNIVLYLEDDMGNIDYQRGRAYIANTFHMYNSSGTTAGIYRTIIEAGNYTITYSGEGNLFQISLVNTSNGYWATQPLSNTTYIDYKYYQVSPAWARVMLNVGLGMATVAILGIVAGFVYLIYRKATD
jgi:hypothetical protein